MHCLQVSKVLAGDDLEPGLVVTVHSVRPKLTKICINEDGTPESKTWSMGEHVYKGLPLCIDSINLPFVQVTACHSNAKLIIDIQEVRLMSVTRDYAVVGMTEAKQAKIKVKPLFSRNVRKRPNTLCDSKGKPHIYPEKAVKPNE